MKSKFLLAAAIFSGCMLTYSFGHAQSRPCGTFEEVKEKLTGEYGETVQAVMRSDTGTVTMWANRISGSWTISLTKPTGETCLVAAGDAYNYVGTAAGEPA